MNTQHKILLVEDDEQIIMMICDMLSTILPAVVVIATSVAEARKAFTEQGPFDAILMDGAVKGGTTYEFIQELRAELAFHGPIVAMSSNESGRQMQIDAGCSHRLDAKHNAGRFLQQLLAEKVAPPG